MLKSTLVKWAVAAVLAVPAVPLFGSTRHHHRATLSTRTHRLVSATAKSHRLVKSATHRKSTTLIHRKKLTKKLTSRRHGALKTTARHGVVRHTSLSSTSHFRVHVTKMPPTIDGIQT